MKSMASSKSEFLAAFIMLSFIFPFSVFSQLNPKQITSYEDYAEEFLAAENDYTETLEEWQNMIDQWLEKPLCLNNEEADWLMEYRIISLYQLNKLKEYQYIYGNLLSVYELSFIEGWDFQTVRKVIPLVTTISPTLPRTFKKFSFRSFRHSLLFKTAFNTQKSKAYTSTSSDETSAGEPIYTGAPVRLALRYDLEYRKKLAFGLRMEKDAGEPFLVPSSLFSMKIKTPDLISGYLQLKELGPVKSIIMGDYRVNFGYGVNIAGGQSGIKGRSGMSGMAHRIRPQTSVSESGFFRGAAISAVAGRLSITAFASMQHFDGTSIIYDSISGKPISFSSMNKSGLHRSASELSGRKTIMEKVLGGFLVYRNNWLKTGIIALYNSLGAPIAKNEKPYARFDLSGKQNLITGLSATIWHPKFQLFTEASVSRNKGMAYVSGIQLMPVPGALVVITQRNFSVGYQNWYGSGYISASRNTGERGLQVSFRLEMPKRWLFEIMTDHSRSLWASYDLTAPTRQREVMVSAEKNWLWTRSLVFSFRYKNKPINNPANSFHICHPASSDQFKLRLEGRIEASTTVRFKSRVECNLIQGLQPGWLIFQDIEFNPEVYPVKIWLRACFFEAMDYDSRIYAYENDVLYDFTSLMHYGKGLRGVLMTRFSPSHWLDIWLRLSTIYYTNKNIGSGWDEIEGNRQNEIEVQIRVRVPD
jgi:hypothetical protein